MSEDFSQRGYPKQLVDSHKNKVLSMTSILALQGLLPKETQKRLPFVSTYNNLSPKITNILNKHWPTLRRSYLNILEFQQPPLMSFRRPPNLRDCLSQN